MSDRQPIPLGERVLFHVHNMADHDSIHITKTDRLLHVDLNGLQLALSPEAWRIVVDQIDEAIHWPAMKPVLR